MQTHTQNILGYNFEGPYPTQNLSGKIPGIYIISTSDYSIDINNVIDVGETQNIEERIANHERKNCWLRQNGNYLWFHSDDNQERRLFKEKALRNMFSPTCGER